MIMLIISKMFFHEIPHQFLDEKKDIVNFIAASFNGKGMLRCVDYRKSLLLTALHCQQKYPDSGMTDILSLSVKYKNFYIYLITKGVVKRS